MGHFGFEKANKKPMDHHQRTTSPGDDPDHQTHHLEPGISVADPQMLGVPYINW